MRRHRAGPVRAAAAVAAWAVCLTSAPAGSAPAGRAFLATAVAQGVRATYTVPRFLVLETLADGAAPLAQAQVGSVTSSAFASTLYPGDTAITNRQATDAAGLPPFPPYPFYVSAEHPVDPANTARGPGYDMSARAAEREAAARAAGGSSAGETASAAASVADAAVNIEGDGTVVARAVSVVQGARYGGVLSIGSVRSEAVARLAPGASEPTLQTRTVVSGVRVGDVAAEVGPDGVRAAGATAGPPGADSLDATLAKAGLVVRRVGAEPLAGGGSADAIEIRSTPPLALPGVPPGTVTYRLGGAMATVVGAGGPLPASPAPEAGATVSVTTGRQPMGSEAGGGPAASPPPIVDAGAGPEPSPPPIAAALPSASDLAAPAGARTAPAPDRSDAALAAPPAAVARPAAPVRLAADLDHEVGSFYLVLVLAGVAAIAAGGVWRAKGVNTPWSS